MAPLKKDYGLVDIESETEATKEKKVSNEYVLNVAFLSFFFFTAFQFFFAIIAESQSMMADCAAMTVDVVTYLFNFLAERLKEGHNHNNNGSIMSPKQLRLRRLYLELIPPLISVTTLVVVTILALREAFDTLAQENPQDDPNLAIMLIFSALNLLLDFLNVGCFARVDQAIGLPKFEKTTTYDEILDEETPLKKEPQEDDLDSTDGKTLNLNMCSAWTHVCADTLRSVAVLIAAGFATLFPQYMTSAEADSYGAIVVSIIILISLGPLLQGLYKIAMKIRHVWSLDHYDTTITLDV